MGFIERLRETDWGPNVTDTLTRWDHARYQAADALERLKGYAAHSDECAINGWLPRGDEPCPPCSCGLSTLLREIDGC